MSHPALPHSRGVPQSSSGPGEQDCVPTTFPLQRLFVKAPGSQEARRGLVPVAVAAVQIPQLVAPTVLVAAPAAQQGHEGPAVAPNNVRNWCPRALSAQLPPSHSSSL